jgi:alginate O-acetyltransferase complex protein AlgI
LADAILPAALEGDVLPALRGIPLPIGISFYTFQGISLLVDIHRDRGEVATRLADLAGEGDRSGVRRGVRFTAHVGLYIAFFPQLIAGPIVRASQFFHQIEPKRPADIRWNLAGRALIGGYFLKMFVADNLAEHTAVLTSGEFDGFTKVDLLALVYGYSAQIFADFAGYSLIAIGLGHLFGYQLPVNFRTPYNSTSITEFWQRWHISLSSWLREYLYISLGGNRRGRRRTAVNLLVVMVLGGLWHGASWNFAGWGLAHGLILAAERAVAGGRYGRPELVSAATRVPRILCTFTMVSLLWLFFVTPDASASADFFARLVTAPVGLSILNGGLANAQIYALALFVFPVVVHHVVALLGEQRTTPARRRASPARVRGAVETTALGTMLFLVATNSGVTGEFIYFTF